MLSQILSLKLTYIPTYTIRYVSESVDSFPQNISDTIVILSSSLIFEKKKNRDMIHVLEIKDPSIWGTNILYTQYRGNQYERGELSCFLTIER